MILTRNEIIKLFEIVTNSNTYAVTLIQTNSSGIGRNTEAQYTENYRLQCEDITDYNTW